MSTRTHIDVQPGARTGASARGRLTLEAAAGAAIANLALWAAARAGGAGMRMPDFSSPGATRAVGAGEVVLASVVPVLLAGLLWRLVASRPRGVRALAWTAGAVAVLSAGAPLSAPVDGGTRLALAAMHLVAGAAVVLALRRGRS